LFKKGIIKKKTLVGLYLEGVCPFTAN